MRKILVIAFLVLFFFIVEFFLFNIFGYWFFPNLLLLLIMFMNLYLGIRYSILTALLGGILKDCFGAQLFGFNVFSFLIGAYATTFLKNWVYHIGSPFSRLILIFLVLIIYLSSCYVIYSMFYEARFMDAVRFIAIPQTVTTLLMANSIFKVLKLCVSKLYV